MALALTKPTNYTTPQNPNALNQSIQDLLAEAHKETPNFSHFIHVFNELMQAKLDPSLESIWVYAGLTFRSRNLPKDDLLDRITASKDLFQLVSACSASCGSSKSVALLAPVVFEMYKVVVELLGKDLALKRERKAMGEVKSLVEVVLGYINLSCSKDSSEECDSVGSKLITPLADLVRVWMDLDDGIESFLPLVSADVCKRLSIGDCDVGQLAGVVIAEVFLLKFCLKFDVGIAREELEKDLRIWAVGSITSLRNIYFFETLVRMLLEETLPVTSLLSSEDEVLLRKVLYGAVILVEYSFLNPESDHIPAEHMKSLAMARLIVTHEAIEFFREGGDQMRAVSYINAFSSSHLPSQITKWVTSQTGMDEKANRLNGSSPKALIKWLLNLEDQGIRVFDDSISKCRSKLVLDISKADVGQFSSKLEDKKVDDDTLFYIDNKGEEEDTGKEDKINESMKKSTEKGGRKRKEGRSTEKKKKIKFVKYDLPQNSDSTRARSSLVSNDGFNSDSEVENPVSDDDTETN